MGYIQRIAEHPNPNVATAAIEVDGILVDSHGAVTGLTDLRPWASQTDLSSAQAIEAAALFDPAVLIVPAAFAAFVAVVTVSVFVMRWLIIRRNPEIGEDPLALARRPRL